MIKIQVALLTGIFVMLLFLAVRPQRVGRFIPWDEAPRAFAVLDTVTGHVCAPPEAHPQFYPACH